MYILCVQRELTVFESNARYTPYRSSAGERGGGLYMNICIVVGYPKRVYWQRCVVSEIETI